MEEKKTLFDYIGQIFTTFGMIVLIFLVFGVTLGDKAQSHSSLFALGSVGYSVQTLFQLFVLSVILSVAEIVFLSDAVIKKMGAALRNLCFFTATIVVIIVFATLCGWFPVSDPKAWIGFFLSYAVCTAISIGIITLKERAENKKMEEALRRFQGKE